MNFIDDVTLPLLASAAGLIFVLIFGWGSWQRNSQSGFISFVDDQLEKHRGKAWPLLGVSIIMLTIGYPIVWSWPLAATQPPSGNANIVIGWPLVWFGIVFLLAGMTMLFFNGEAKAGLFWICVFAAVGGFMNLALAIGILKSGVGHPPASEDAVIQIIFSPPLWAIVYSLTGLATILSPIALRVSGWPRIVMAVCLLIACIVLLFSGFGTLISHIEMFKAFPLAH